MTKENQDKRPVIAWSLLQTPISKTKILEAGFNPKTVLSEVSKGEILVDRDR